MKSEYKKKKVELKVNDGGWGEKKWKTKTRTKNNQKNENVEFTGGTIGPNMFVCMCVCVSLGNNKAGNILLQWIIRLDKNFMTH